MLSVYNDCETGKDLIGLANVLGHNHANQHDTLLSPSSMRFRVAALPVDLFPGLTMTDKSTTYLDRYYEPLTEREIEILAHLAEDLSNAEIAQALVLSVATVKVHARSRVVCGGSRGAFPGR